MPLTPSGSAIKRGVKRGRCVIEITVTWLLILPTPAEMRVSGSENFQNWRRIGFLFLQNQKIGRPVGFPGSKSSGGEDSATGQCGASFQQTRTNLCSTSGDAQAGNGTAPFALFGCVSLIFQPIPPTVNDLPLLVANRTKFEKVGPFIL